MTREIWINLPVKDVNRSRDFFTSIGFRLNEHYGNNDSSASLLIGNKNIVLMLFAESIFKGFVQHPVSDTQQGSEVLFSLDAESRAEVDEVAKKAEAAGGHVFGRPGESQGWMYGCGFSDPDGHRWNVVHMDFSKMPQQ